MARSGFRDQRAAAFGGLPKAIQAVAAQGQGARGLGIHQPTDLCGSAAAGCRQRISGRELLQPVLTEPGGARIGCGQQDMGQRQGFIAVGWQPLLVDAQGLPEAGADLADVHARLDCGEAHAALSTDYQEAQALGVKGSPSLVLNEGRQTLYGNVGYRIIEANIEGLLREPAAGAASWC